jgi:hypothetical protein
MIDVKRKVQLESIVGDFIDEIQSDAFLAEKCFSICYPLSLLLKSKNIETSIMSGFFGWRPHYILKLTEDDAVFIDPTMKQFGPHFPELLVGYHQQYASFHLIDFDLVYDFWIEPLLNEGVRFSNIVTSTEKFAIDLPAFLQLNLRAASVLLKNIDLTSFQHSEQFTKMLQKYLAGIKKIMDFNSERTEVLEYCRHDNDLKKRISEVELSMSKSSG